MSISDAELDAWIERSWPRSANESRPPWTRDVFREYYEEEIAYGARQAAESLQAKELISLSRRVAALERETVALRKHAGGGGHGLGALGRAVAEAMPKIIAAHLEKRLDTAVAKAIEERGAMADAGVWDAKRTYKRGDVTSHNGTAWCSQVTSTGLRPGTSSGWRMIAKSDISTVRREVKDEVNRALKGQVK